MFVTVANLRSYKPVKPRFWLDLEKTYLGQNQIWSQTAVHPTADKRCYKDLAKFCTQKFNNVNTALKFTNTKTKMHKCDEFWEKSGL